MRTHPSDSYKCIPMIYIRSLYSSASRDTMYCHESLRWEASEKNSFVSRTFITNFFQRGRSVAGSGLTPDLGQAAETVIRPGDRVSRRCWPLRNKIIMYIRAPLFFLIPVGRQKTFHVLNCQLLNSSSLPLQLKMRRAGPRPSLNFKCHASKWISFEYVAH